MIITKTMDSIKLPYEIHASEDLGRYLVASRDLSPGDIVIEESPIVFGPKAMADPESKMPCVGCYKPIFTDVGERCSKCGWPVCSGNCPGLTDPRHHGVECHILSSRPHCVLDNMAEYYRHDALLPLRCLLLKNIDPERWKLVMDMQSHMESRAPGTEAYDEADEFIVDYLITNFISKLDGDIKTKYLPHASKELLHTICGIIDTNALEIRLPDGSELNGLYAKTSVMEHSCVPNTKHTFKIENNLKICVKVVVPILKGQHIATMYSHALWGTQARRQHLQETKYFSCKCLRCTDPTELGTYLSAMKCMGDGKEQCDGIHLPEDPLDDETDWACSKCKVKVGNSHVNAIISQMGEEVDGVLMMGGAVPMLENILCRLTMFLHPNHYHLYSIKHSLVQLYGRQPSYSTEDILDKKIKMCKDLIFITKTLDPGNARLSLYNSVLHHELHSALVLKSKKVKSCLKTRDALLKEAKDAIEIALSALSDDLGESSGRMLFSVIEGSDKEFKVFCKQNNVTF
ncbi:SET domain-containing protein SmydA-8 [Pieris rapae]|uniref:SET domain-containing protein SmydA-8 n=1 Tax=Pieris rapae TaxID=64459 RepID=UPI001E27AB8F|nr:SET domain-containing protein SmydA-8 [Pieris rapae]